MHVGNQPHARGWHLTADREPPGHLSPLTSQPARKAVITSTVLLIHNNILHVHFTLELLPPSPTGCLCHSLPLSTTLGNRKAWAMVAMSIVIIPVETPNPWRDADVAYGLHTRAYTLGKQLKFFVVYIRALCCSNWVYPLTEIFQLPTIKGFS